MLACRRFCLLEIPVRKASDCVRSRQTGLGCLLFWTIICGVVFSDLRLFHNN